MSQTTYTKAHLQSLNANKSSLVVEQLYQGMVEDVFNAAAAGKTSFTFDMLLLQVPKDRIFPDFNSSPMHPMMRGLVVPNQSSQSNPAIRYPLKISPADLVAGLQAKFPDCSVTLLGDANAPPLDLKDHNVLSGIMNSYHQGTYVCQTGVVVDWS